MKTYYILINDEVKGPYTETDLLIKKAHDEITDGTLVAEEGDQEWRTYVEKFGYSNPTPKENEQAEDTNEKFIHPLTIWCYVIAGLSAIGCLMVGVQSEGALMLAWLLGGAVYALIWVILGVLVDNTDTTRRVSEENKKAIEKNAQELKKLKKLLKRLDEK